MSVTQPGRHLQSRECSELTSQVRAREMQKAGVPQSLSLADSGQAGTARADLTPLKQPGSRQVMTCLCPAVKH